MRSNVFILAFSISFTLLFSSQAEAAVQADMVVDAWAGWPSQGSLATGLPDSSGTGTWDAVWFDNLDPTQLSTMKCWTWPDSGTPKGAWGFSWDGTHDTGWASSYIGFETMDPGSGVFKVRSDGSAVSAMRWTSGVWGTMTFTFTIYDAGYLPGATWEGSKHFGVYRVSDGTWMGDTTYNPINGSVYAGTGPLTVTFSDTVSAGAQYLFAFRGSGGNGMAALTGTVTGTAVPPEAADPIRINSGWADISVVDETLDLATMLQETLDPSESPAVLVEMAPKIVVGEGADPQNHTVIRVLNEYGIAEFQFLAYPTSVNGGVNVNVGEIFPPQVSIVASPISSISTRQIRIFSDDGLLQAIFEPDPLAINAPFVVAVGDYLPGQVGDEIAIASANQTSGNRDVLVYNGLGDLLGTFGDPGSLASDDTLVMGTYNDSGTDKILFYYQSAKKAVLLNASTSNTIDHNLGSLPSGAGIYQSAFSEDLFVSGTDETLYSTLYKVDPSTTVNSVDAGTKENIFWVSTSGSYDPWSDSQYVKRGNFRHIRTDMSCNGYANASFSSDDYSVWIQGDFKNWVESTQADYSSSYPSNWEPCFTHRHHDYALPSAWKNELDSATGLNKYMMLSRLNNLTYYEEGPTTFENLTYAHNLPAMDHLYVWPIREYVRRLADKFRGSSGDPDQFVAVTPCHEWEIFVSQDGSIGDYNPAMITGFYSHLINLYGSIGKINSKYGTSFTGAGDFDAPRNTGRGGWDAYNSSNPFFFAWVEYNRKVIFRRLAQVFRECLWAGFPPESIKTHQIPAKYVIGDPLNGSNRITPIDWILSAGTGYGGTRYGLWYQNSNNWIQGAYSSGQSMITIGEYHPITSNQGLADGQASYMFNNGVQWIAISGDSNLSVTKNSYLQLQTGNPPRPGTTGGIGQIRAVTSDDNSYNIACVGTGDKTGLLKSLSADGSWDGTVYVVPFHSHVAVTPIGVQEQDFHLTTTDYTTGSVTALASGSQIEISFRARTDDLNGTFTLLVLHDGTELGRFRRVVDVDSDWAFYRFILRGQMSMGGVTVLLNSGERNAPSAYTQDIEIENFSALVLEDSITRFDYGINSGTPHQGGVTFDVIVERTLATEVVVGDGTISPVSGTYLQGGTVQLTANPDPGYRVKYWLGTDDDSIRGNTNQVTLTDDTVVRVAFELIADVNNDGSVDLEDLALTANSWLYEFCCDGSPVGYWAFDETSGTTATDSSIYGRDGMLFNFPTDDSQWTDGETNGALSFDGQDDYVEISGYNGISGGANRTCAAWVKTTQAPGEIITWGNSDPGRKWIIRVNETGALRAEVSGGYIYGTTPVNDGCWHHVAVVLNSDITPDISEVSLYVDGQLETISGVADEPIDTASAQDVAIGVYTTTATRYFKGLMDEVRIYDRALSPDEVEQLYLGVDSNYDGTVDLYDFSQLAFSWQKSYSLALVSSASTDWSDQDNPNGYWSYRSDTGLITTQQSAWLPGDLGSNQPAWAATAEGVPGWFKSTGLGSHDIPQDVVACHAPTVLRWTSPVNGTITISGGCWLVRDIGRTINLTLSHAGTDFSSASITRANGNSVTPFDFTNMSGGGGVLTRTVNVGDMIDLRIDGGDFVGVDLTIEYTW